MWATAMLLLHKQSNKDMRELDIDLSLVYIFSYQLSKQDADIKILIKNVWTTSLKIKEKKCFVVFDLNKTELY